MRFIKKTLLALTLSSITTLTISHSASAANLRNVALEGTATASRTYRGSDLFAPNNAIDGDETTSWNAGEHPTQWLEIDLGEAAYIHEIVGIVAQSPAGGTRHDIYLDDIFSFRWEGFTTSGQTLSHELNTPTLAQTVRILSTAGPSWVAWREVKVLAGPGPKKSSVPEPSMIFSLAAMGVGGLVAARRKA